MTTSMFELVATIIAEEFQLPLEQIHPQTNLVNDLGFDSLDLVRLATRFEEEFYVGIPTNCIHVKTVGEAVELVEGILRHPCTPE